jgi:hypothetical protein
MEEHINRKLEELTDRMMKEIDVEKPSMDFTNSIMQGIHEQETKKVTQYKPLISTPVWTGLGITFMGLLYFIVSTNETTNSNWLNNLDFSVLINNTFTDSITSFTLPKTMAYAIGLFGLMLCIQIPFLKHYFDKRFQV